MTTDAAPAAPAQPPAPPAAPAGQQPPPAAPAASATLDERVGSLETEQRRQGGILERIEAALTGGGGGGRAPAAEPVNVADAVQQGIEKIRSKERRDKEAADKATEAEEWKKSVETRLTERRPAAPATGFKSKVQRAFFGAPDER